MRFRGGSRHLLPREVVGFDGGDRGEELREREQLRHLAHRGLLGLDAQILHGSRPPRMPPPPAAHRPRESPPNPVGRRGERGAVGMGDGEIASTAGVVWLWLEVRLAVAGGEIPNR